MKPTPSLVPRRAKAKAPKATGDDAERREEQLRIFSEMAATLSADQRRHLMAFVEAMKARR